MGHPLERRATSSRVPSAALALLVLAGMAACARQADPPPLVAGVPGTPNAVAPGLPGAPAAPPGALPSPPHGALPAPPPPVSGPARAPAGGASCESITDCAACTARPDCRLCTYIRGCMSKASVDGGACLASALDSPAACGSDPVKLREKERVRDAEQRRAAILAATQGMTPAGPPFEARLEKLGTMEIPVSAGLCHILVWSLAADARPGDVRISLAFVTHRSSDGGLTGFDTNARMGSTGLVCSSQPGKESFRLVDRWTYAPVPSAGTGGLSFVLFTRMRGPGDPDDIGSESARVAPAAPSRGGGDDGWGGSGYYDCAAEQPRCRHECGHEESLCKMECPSCSAGCEQQRRSCERHCADCR